jgi:hypothetical protein
MPLKVGKPCRILLAIALAGVSACAAAGPSAPDSGVPAEFRGAALDAPFPKSLSEDGLLYSQLSGAALVRELHGKMFCPSASCSGIDGIVERFADNGDYLAAGDRFDDQGRYVILGDKVIVKIGGMVRTYAFYRSTDGALRRAWVERGGKIQSSKVFTK